MGGILSKEANQYSKFNDKVLDNMAMKLLILYKMINVFYYLKC